MQFTKIALLGLNYSAEYLRSQVPEVEDVYLAKATPEQVDDMEQAGLTVHPIRSLETLPADVFQWYRKEGQWATVHKGTRVARDITYAEDSLSAARALLGAYEPESREQFVVRPVRVEVVHGYPNDPFRVPMHVVEALTQDCRNLLRGLS